MLTPLKGDLGDVSVINEGDIVETIDVTTRQNGQKIRGNQVVPEGNPERIDDKTKHEVAHQVSRSSSAPPRSVASLLPVIYSFWKLKLQE